MRRRKSDRLGRDDARNTFEHALTNHLERAHELGERLQEANGSLSETLRRTQEILDQLRGRVDNKR